VNYFTSVFYIATDVGCLGAGLAVKVLSARGSSVHRSRVVTFLGCALLTALGSTISIVPAGPTMLAILLLIAAGALGLFPIYYSLRGYPDLYSKPGKGVTSHPRTPTGSTCPFFRHNPHGSVIANVT
jgi:hypothetical protein